MSKVLPISEISVVIQGEGISIGEPMILVRMSGCELNCQFKKSICDSSEVSWLHGKKEFSLTAEDLQAKILENWQVRKMLITGGHPFFNPEAFIEIATIAKNNGLAVEVESNGLGYKPDIYSGLIDLITISPKLSNSVPVPGTYIEQLGREVTEKDMIRHDKARKNVESMCGWIDNFNCQLKFVISCEDDIAEAIDLILELDVDNDRVYFMPEAGSRKQLEENSPWLYQQCIDLGVKFSTRLHIQLFDTKKFV